MVGFCLIRYYDVGTACALPVHRDQRFALRWAVPLELSPRLVGAISGVMNGSGNFAGIFGPMTAGFIIKETGNWTLPFLIAAFFAVISVLVFYFLVVPEPLTVKEPVSQTVPRKIGA